MPVNMPGRYRPHSKIDPPTNDYGLRIVGEEHIPTVAIRGGRRILASQVQRCRHCRGPLRMRNGHYVTPDRSKRCASRPRRWWFPRRHTPDIHDDGDSLAVGALAFGGLAIAVLVTLLLLVLL